MIREKLKVLRENDVIDEKVEEKVLQAGELLIEEEIIKDLDEADVFLTHLAMSFSREEELNEVDDSIKNQIVNNEHYSKAVDVWKKLRDKLDLDHSESEDDYMFMHLLTLLEKGGFYVLKTNNENE